MWMTGHSANPNRPFSLSSVAGDHRAPNTTAPPSLHFKDNTMTTLIGSLLLGYRTHSRRQSVQHLDERLLADIGLTREDFRRAPTKKSA